MIRDLNELGDQLHLDHITRYQELVKGSSQIDLRLAIADPYPRTLGGWHVKG